MTPVNQNPRDVNACIQSQNLLDCHANRFLQSPVHTVSEYSFLFYK